MWETGRRGAGGGGGVDDVRSWTSGGGPWSYLRHGGVRFTVVTIGQLDVINGYITVGPGPYRLQDYL